MIVDRRNISPKDLSKERLALLVEEAGKAFLEKGYSGCSMDHISRASGVSKSTIYRHFPDKEALYELVNERIADEQAALVMDFDLDLEDPGKSLRAYARHIYAVDTNPRFLEFFRLLLAEAGRLPNLTARLRERGIATVLGKLTGYFQALTDRKLMSHPDPRQAAVTFYVLARGNFRPLLGVEFGPDEELRRLDIDIDIFLKGSGIP